jgi:Flp pilus assembly protein TadD
LGPNRAVVSALQQVLKAKPDSAPAILSLGAVEYQRGRRGVGRKLFHSLLSWPEDTAELCEIIDDAGDFLIQRRAYRDGLELFRGAAARFPGVGAFHQGLACCAGHRGFHDEAVAASRRALELEPSNQKFVNDLGWSLFLAGQLQEAEETLARAVSMDPDDALARKNLSLCQEKRSSRRRTRPARPSRRTQTQPPDAPA